MNGMHSFHLYPVHEIDVFLPAFNYWYIVCIVFRQYFSNLWYGFTLFSTSLLKMIYGIDHHAPGCILDNIVGGFLKNNEFTCHEISFQEKYKIEFLGMQNTDNRWYEDSEIFTDFLFLNRWVIESWNSSMKVIMGTIIHRIVKL